MMGNNLINSFAVPQVGDLRDEKEAVEKRRRRQRQRRRRLSRSGQWRRHTRT